MCNPCDNCRRDCANCPQYARDRLWYDEPSTCWRWLTVIGLALLSAGAILIVVSCATLHDQCQCKNVFGAAGCVQGGGPCAARECYVFDSYNGGAAQWRCAAPTSSNSLNMPLGGWTPLATGIASLVVGFFVSVRGWARLCCHCAGANVGLRRAHGDPLGEASRGLEFVDPATLDERAIPKHIMDEVRAQFYADRHADALRAAGLPPDPRIPVVVVNPPPPSSAAQVVVVHRSSVH